MSEVNENLNEQVEEEIDDAAVVTVPIDETLTRHGEAADAKAVGDALKALQNDVTVNGQGKDANNDIKVGAEHVPYSTGVSVKQKIDILDGKTAEDIPMTSGQGAQSVAQAIENAGAKSADHIPMSDGSIETVAERIGVIEQNVEAIGGALEDYESTTDAEIEALQMEIVELTDAEIHGIVSEVFEGEDDE